MSTEQIDQQIQAQITRVNAASRRKLDAMEEMEKADAEIAEGRAIIAGLQYARTLFPANDAAGPPGTIDDGTE